MVGLLDGEKTLRICITVYTQYRRVTDGRTDRLTDGRTSILLRHSPRYAYASRGRNWVHLILSKPLKILKISIRSPRSLLVSSDVRPNLRNLSSYDKLPSFIINRVALFCTFSNMSMSFFKYGRHACTQYSSFGLTKD